jgi:ATP-dependent RNA helicase DDX54/DBP10
VLANRGNPSTDKNASAAAVILSPTRELSLQTLKVLKTLSSYCLQIKSIGINGGESMEKQFSLLSSKPDIICATPGRLAHHINEIPDFNLSQCDIVVFDEADRLFEMGFALQIRSICSSMPSADSGRQTLLFSATMPKILVEFTKSGIMGDPQVVRLDSEATVSEELRIGFVTVRSAEKDAALLYLLREVLPQTPASTANDQLSKSSDDRKQMAGLDDEKSKKRKISTNISALGLTLIFAATRHHVDYITTLVNNSGMSAQATCIYGAMDQEARKLNLSLFRSGRYPILVVTDVAARVSNYF